jgi:3-methyladenine DNA glycosylase AlkD
MADLGKAATTDEILAHLRSLRDEEAIAGMARYGIETRTALGIPNAVLRPLARRLGRNHGRALDLWRSGIREARLLAAFTAEPKVLTAETAREWAAEFDSWEIVDGVADLFAEARLQQPLIAEFADDAREFVRRTAFTMIAWSAVHEKTAPDAEILSWLPLIERHAGDERNFVCKAVNWALRQIGKRNAACYGPALELAKKLADSPDRTRRWVGRDADRELTKPAVLKRIAGTP